MPDDGAAPPIPLDLPWYFAAFIAVVWLAVCYGIVRIVGYRLRQRAARRARDRRLAGGRAGDVIDVEAWEIGE